MNLDINQEPFVDPSPSSPPATSAPGFGSFLVEHETPRRPIEDRIRFAIRASARQPQTSLMSVIEPIVGERFKNHKRDITHLAKALEMDVDDKGVLFDCNICLGMAKDPILTCCGHLFCWGCFYHVPYVDSVSKECPVCYGEVIDSNVTPVYGNGNGKNSLESDSRVTIPPRPQARRVESIRQESLFHNTMVDAVSRVRDGLVMIEEIPSGINLSNLQGRRYGGLAADGDVEIDLAVSGSRRRRRRRIR